MIRLSLVIALFTSLVIGHTVMASSEGQTVSILSLLLGKSNRGGDSGEELPKLGVDVDIGPRTSSVDGEELPEDAHPLPHKSTSLGKIDELFGAGFVYREGYGYRHFLLDDASDPDFTVDRLTPSGDDSWTEAHNKIKFKAGVAADIDKDGFQEIIVAYTVIREEGGQDIVEEVKFRVIQDESEDFSEVTLSPLAPLGDLGDATASCSFEGVCLDLSAGDLDDDGADELVLAENFSRSLYILDGENLTLASVEAMQASENDILLVDVADVDADKKAEIAVAISDGRYLDGVSLGSYAIYDYDNNELSEIKSGPVSTATAALENVINVVAADVDGDNIPEVVFGGRNITEGYAALFVMEDGRGLSPVELGESYSFIEEINLSGWAGTLERGDFNGDGFDDIFAYNRLVDLHNNSQITLPCPGDDITPQMVAVGNFDNFSEYGDRDDIAVAWLEESGSALVPVLTVYGVLPGTNRAQNLNGYNIDIGTVDPGLYYWDSVQNGVLVAGNVDSDTRVIEFTGNHTVLFSDPLIMAVLASPPFHGDLQHAEGYTLFGDSTTTGSNTTHAIGAHFGATIGVSAKSPFSTFELETKLKTTIAADYAESEGSSITYSSAIQSPAGVDTVIFTAIPYDAYSYRVLQSPIEDEVGKLFSLNMPRKQRAFSVERNFFNANNGDGPDVDERILTHTIGIPSSYPTIQARNSFLSGSRFAYVSNMTHSCGGAGAIGILGCEWSNEHSEDSSIDLSMEVEAESTIGGLLLGFNSGVHFGVEAEIHWSDSTFIEGAVGDMLPSDFSVSRSFDWGVFTYEAELPGNGGPIVVVYYWYEP